MLYLHSNPNETYPWKVYFAQECARRPSLAAWPKTTAHATSRAPAASDTDPCACARHHSFWMTWTHYIWDGETYEGWGYFYEEGYETAQAVQARLATFLRNNAGWSVEIEEW